MRTRSQRLLSMVLALSMLLTFLPVSAFAEGTPPPYDGPQTLNDNNTCTEGGNTYTYSLNTADNTATLTSFTGTGTTANVPKTVKKGETLYTVTAIGEYAFTPTEHRPNKDLQSVNLPDSIRTIEAGAFFGCHSLQNITLREGLTEVKTSAFLGADLETIDWPKSLTIVGNAAFHMMDSHAVPKPIKTITYPGTKAQWDEMAGPQNFATTNPQLVPKDTEHPNGVDLHCAHTVTFNANGHGTDPDNQVVDKQVVEYEGHASKPSDPTADGYTFKYWFTTSENGEEKEFNFNTEIIEDTELFAHWEEKTTPEKPSQPTTPEQPGTNPPQQNPDKPTPPQEKPNEPTPPESTDKPNKPNEPTPPEVPAVEEDDTAAIGYAAAAVTAAFVGWGAYRIGSEVYLKYLLPKDVLLPQNRIQLAELLWEDAGRPAPADAAAYTDVDDTDARQAARWAVENGLLTLPDTEKPEEFVPYRSVSYAKSARAWNQAQQLKENAAAR